MYAQADMKNYKTFHCSKCSSHRNKSSKKYGSCIFHKRLHQPHMYNPCFQPLLQKLTWQAVPKTYGKVFTDTVHIFNELYCKNCDAW